MQTHNAARNPRGVVLSWGMHGSHMGFLLFPFVRTRDGIVKEPFRVLSFSGVVYIYELKPLIYNE